MAKLTFSELKMLFGQSAIEIDDQKKVYSTFSSFEQFKDSFEVSELNAVLSFMSSKQRTFHAYFNQTIAFRLEQLILNCNARLNENQPRQLRVRQPANKVSAERLPANIRQSPDVIRAAIQLLQLRCSPTDSAYASDANTASRHSSPVLVSPSLFSGGAAVVKPHPQSDRMTL